jgi:hypothetical protein
VEVTEEGIVEDTKVGVVNNLGGVVKASVEEVARALAAVAPLQGGVATKAGAEGKRLRRQMLHCAFRTCRARERAVPCPVGQPGGCLQPCLQ